MSACHKYKQLQDILWSLRINVHRSVVCGQNNNESPYKYFIKCLIAKTKWLYCYSLHLCWACSLKMLLDRIRTMNELILVMDVLVKPGETVTMV